MNYVLQYEKEIARDHLLSEVIDLIKEMPDEQIIYIMEQMKGDATNGR